MAFASISTGKATNYTIAPFASPIACYRFPRVLLLDLGTSPAPIHAGGLYWLSRNDIRFRRFLPRMPDEKSSANGLWIFAKNLLLSLVSDKWRTNMNTEYKGYRITAWPERDDTTGLWNGRYRYSRPEGHGCV